MLVIRSMENTKSSVMVKDKDLNLKYGGAYINQCS
jgi:hypothetical protein